MIPSKLKSYLDTRTLPQRLLLSGDGAWDVALQVAAQLQGLPQAALSKGGDGDSLVLSDDGKSFKIDWSESAKRDGQGPHENVRGLVRWVSQKPIKDHRIVLLQNFERCSRDAPQALLKIIEEPPPKALFLFTTQNHYQILPTILSRITVVSMPTQHTKTVDDQALDFLASSDLLEQFQQIESLDKTVKKEKDRTLNTTFVTDLITAAQNESRFHSRLDGLLQAHVDLKANLNPRLVLEKMVLDWHVI